MKNSSLLLFVFIVSCDGAASLAPPTANPLGAGYRLAITKQIEHLSGQCCFLGVVAFCKPSHDCRSCRMSSITILGRNRQ